MNNNIIRLYKKGSSMSELARIFKTTEWEIKKILIEAKVYNFVWCLRCGKKFPRGPKNKGYCGNPCTMSEIREIHGRDYIEISRLRKKLWTTAKSNPEEVLRIRKLMIKEEGKKYADIITQKIIESTNFKKWLKSYREH